MTLPSYVQAAQDHTIANATEETWVDTFLNLPETIGLGVVAAGTELYNIVPSIGNMLGGDFEIAQTRDVIQSFDEDMAQYYDQHQTGIDALGFAIGMMAPGLGVIKVLNAGQKVLRTAVEKGTFGTGIGRSLGLLAPNRDKHIADAIKSIRASGDAFAVTEANTMKALISGMGQSALEMGAWEIAVNTTMYNSPVLKQQDLSDMLYNSLWNTAIFGGVGGIFYGVGAAYKIHKAGALANAELAPWNTIAMPSDRASISDRILFMSDQLETMRPLPTTGDLVERAGRLADQKKAAIWSHIREDFQRLTGDDRDLAETFFQTFKSMDPEDRVANFIDSLSASRMSMPSAVEQELRALEKKAKDAGGLLNLTPEELDAWRSMHVSYVRTIGEDVGQSLKDKPLVTSITDLMHKKDTISISKDNKTIWFGKKSYSFDNNPNRAFNILAVPHKTTEARYFWAERLPKWVDDMVSPYQVHATDLPLLEKAYFDGLERLSIIPESGEIKAATTLTSRQQIYDFMVQQKRSLAYRLQNIQPNNITLGDFVDRMKSYFGINFNVGDSPGAYGYFTRISKKGDHDYRLRAAFNKGEELAGDVIALDRKSILTEPMSRMMQTLLHEQGHRTYQALLDAGGTSTQNLATRMPLLMTELRAIGDKVRPAFYKYADRTHSKSVIEHELFADTFWYLSKNPTLMSRYPEIEKQIGHLIKPIPQDIIDSVAKRASKITLEETAKIVNVERKWLDKSGVRAGGEFARDMARKEYRERMLTSGARESEIPADPLAMPSFAKVISRDDHVRIDGNLVDGMVKVKERTRQHDELSARVGNAIVGEELPAIPDKLLIVGASGGPGIASFSNANYGTLGSILEWVGKITHKAIGSEKAATSDLFSPLLSKLSNDLDQAIEWSVLNEKMRSLPQRYMFDEEAKILKMAGSPEELAAWEAVGVPVEIPIRGETVAELVRTHINRNGARIANLRMIRNAEGHQHAVNPEYFYPIPRDIKDTPHYAFVVDDSITGTGHSKMLYAANAKDLETLINRVREDVPNVMVFTKGEAERYFKERGQFEFERTLNENFFNAALARKGTSAGFLPMTDPNRIVTSFLEWHLARDANMIREAVSHRYQRQFDLLRAAGEGHTLAERSRFGSAAQYAQEASNNPANNLLKLALDIQRTGDYPYWNTFQKLVDGKVSSIVARVDSLLSGATTPEHLQKVTEALRNTGWDGITHLAVDEKLYRAMNSTVDRGTLTSWINKANGVIAAFALRLDPLNAMNNALGMQVLLGSEIKSLMNAIRSGNAEAAGELAALSSITVPGTAHTLTSPQKLIANAYSRYFSRDGAALKELYREKGYITTISDQFDQTMDLLAIRSGDTAVTTNLRFQKIVDNMRQWADAGERFTGNRFAEELNRFVSADVMKQLTDIAVRHGVMDEELAWTYINTFVNRVNGNFLASQRPLMFQGPIGQAIGLFQTYQFNLIQQLLRHVGEGHWKDAVTMMALQSSVYGINGLPGFQAVNTHLIGGASGNPNKTDTYQAVYNAAGKEWGDWLMYGFGSNWMSLLHPDLKTNLYSRGDINPRHITIVPTSPADVPIAQATARFVSNLIDFADKTANGAPVSQGLLRAIELNGVSRPLAGMAQVLRGAASDRGMVTSLSSKDNLLMAHDLYSLASGMRIVGAKPLDEALMNDQMFRIHAYAKKDADRRAVLGEAIKLEILSEGNISEEKLIDFQKRYLAVGGKQEEFAKFILNQNRNATVAQSNQLRDKLSSPYSQGIQTLLGGGRLEDLSK